MILGHNRDTYELTKHSVYLGYSFKHAHSRLNHVKSWKSKKIKQNKVSLELWVIIPTRYQLLLLAKTRLIFDKNISLELLGLVTTWNTKICVRFGWSPTQDRFRTKGSLEARHVWTLAIQHLQEKVGNGIHNHENICETQKILLLLSHSRTTYLHQYNNLSSPVIRKAQKGLIYLSDMDDRMHEIIEFIKHINKVDWLFSQSYWDWLPPELKE